MGLLAALLILLVLLSLAGGSGEHSNTQRLSLCAPPPPSPAAELFAPEQPSGPFPPANVTRGSMFVPTRFRPTPDNLVRVAPALV